MSSAINNLETIPGEEPLVQCNKDLGTTHRGLNKSMLALAAVRLPAVHQIYPTQLH